MISLEIRNDCTGDVEVANYDVRVCLPGVGWVEGRIEGFERALGWGALARLAVSQLENRLS